MIGYVRWLSMLIVALTPLYSYAAGSSTAGTLHQLVRQCERCHSVDSPVHSIAPSLDGMAEVYIVEQLKNFISSRRGSHSTNPFTREMSEQAKGLNDGQIAVLADDYAGRKRVWSKESVAGNAKNGGRLYKKHCEGCHSSMFGRYFTKSPRVTYLRGSYLLAQLRELATGERQVMHDSKHKLKMVLVAKELSDSDRSDIVAFMKSHYTN